MSDDVDTRDCLTKAQAAQVLGTSTKGIERAVQAGELVQHWRRQPGTPDVAVYFPDEVAALGVKRAAERRRGPSGGVLVPGPAVGSSNGNGHRGETALERALVNEALSPQLPAVVSPPPEWVTVLMTAAARLVSQTSETSQTGKVFLTLREAAAYTGLRPKFLRTMIERGTLSAIQDGRTVKVRRKDLEAL